MATIASLPPELILQILTLLASHVNTLPSFATATLSSPLFSRVYFPHRGLLLRLAFGAYLGPFIEPAVALAQLEDEAHVRGLQDVGAIFARTYPADGFAVQDLRTLEAAQRTHRLVLESVVLSTNALNRGGDVNLRKRTAELAARLAVQEDDNPADGRAISFHDVLESYAHFLRWAALRATVVWGGMSAEEFRKVMGPDKNVCYQWSFRTYGAFRFRFIEESGALRGLGSSWDSVDVWCARAWVQELGRVRKGEVAGADRGCETYGDAIGADKRAHGAGGVGGVLKWDWIKTWLTESTVAEKREFIGLSKEERSNWASQMVARRK